MNVLGVQLFPYPFRDPSDDTPLSLGSVTTTLAGTATAVATFADAGLVTPNSNPLTLSAAGYALMYFSPINAGVAGVSYDVVVKDSSGATIWTFDDVSVPVPSSTGNAAPVVIGYGAQSTLTIAGGSITPTKNIHLVGGESGAADDLDTIAITGLPDGAPLIISNVSGAATITVRNNIGNILTSDGNSVTLDTTAKLMTVVRYGSQWRQVVNASSATSQGNAACSGRLTLTSGTPVTTADVTVAGTIYYTPYTGNVIDLYNGTTAWTRLTFTELSLAFTAGANTVYDLFVYNNGGVATLIQGTVWTNATTRALGLTRQDGVLVLASDTTRRYVGTVSATGTSNKTEDSLTKRYLWNYYHRVRRPLQVLEATASWNYATATYRQANAAAGNQVECVVGVSEDSLDLVLESLVFSSAIQQMFVAIGVNSTTTPATQVSKGGPILGANSTENLSAQLTIATAVGRNAYVWLEKGGGAGTVTWYGVNTGDQQSGLTGSLLG